MRVVMLVSSYYPMTTGGIEVYVRNLAGRLRARGHEILFARPASDDGPWPAAADGVSVYHFPFPADLTREEYTLAVLPRRFDEFASWLDSVAPDVVHAHYLSRPAVVPHLEHARDAGARTLVTAHYGALTCLRHSSRRTGTPMLKFGRVQCDGEMRPLRCAACMLEARGAPLPAAWAVAAAENVAGALVPSIEWRVGATAALPSVVRRGRQLLHRLYDAVDWLVVVAEWQRAALLGNGLTPARIARVRHGTEPAPRRQSGPNAPAFGWAGRAIPEKGLAELTDAFLRLDDTSASLVVACWAGSPDEERYRAALVERTRTDARVRWLPPFAAERAGEFYDAIDVLVAPYAVETGPLTAVEALERGIPVVGSDLGGIREVVLDGVNGRLVPYRDVGALTAALAEACNGATRARWSEAARWDRDFDAVAEDYLRLYTGAAAVHGEIGRVATLRGQ